LHCRTFPLLPADTAYLRLVRQAAIDQEDLKIPLSAVAAEGFAEQDGNFAYTSSIPNSKMYVGFL
jgi:hypothetical protein